MTKSIYSKLCPLGWAWMGLSRIKRILNMNQTMPLGISVIYFNDKSKNIYAELPTDKEQAKRLSKRIYKDGVITLATNCLPYKAYSDSGNSTWQ